MKCHERGTIFFIGIFSNLFVSEVNIELSSHFWKSIYHFVHCISQVCLVLVYQESLDCFKLTFRLLWTRLLRNFIFVPTFDLLLCELFCYTLCFNHIILHIHDLFDCFTAKNMVGFLVFKRIRTHYFLYFDITIFTCILRQICLIERGDICGTLNLVQIFHFGSNNFQSLFELYCDMIFNSFSFLFRLFYSKIGIKSCNFFQNFLIMICVD